MAATQNQTIQTPLQTLTAPDLARQGNYLGMLSGLSGLLVSGQNAATFLQGQFTCDITQLQPLGMSGWQQANLGAYCDYKGRMLANFWLNAHADGYTLLLPQPMLSSVAEQLKKYALLSKVTITTIPNWTALLYCHGDNATPTPPNHTAVARGELSIPGTAQRLTWFIAPEEVLLELATQLTQTATTIDPSSCTLLQILAGFSFLQPETSLLFTPQMLNLERLGAVSFRKGCYVGQEVISRTQHLGKLKRRLYRCHIAQLEQAPQPGAKLHNQTGEVGGILVSTAKVTDGFLSLAVIQDNALDQTLLYEKYQVSILQPATQTHL